MDRKLQTVGMASFVEEYDVYAAYSSGALSRVEAVEQLVRRGRSNENGAGWRLGAAKAIFKAGKENEALALAKRRR